VSGSGIPGDVLQELGLPEESSNGAGPGVRTYEFEEYRFEFNPNGNPYTGLLAATLEGSGTYTAEVNLAKAGSRRGYAKEAVDLYGMDAARLKRALNEICTLRTEEVAEAADLEREQEGEEADPEPLSLEAEELVSVPGVLNRYVEDVARIRGVVKDREPLKLQTLVAVGAQLAPIAGGKPAGANLIVTAESGRGKNYICDATAAALPEEFFLAFESASAKSLYYRAESDPEILKHHWIYPNEAEATDELVEMFRPLLSGGRASHLTVNKNAEGRNAAQELSIEGPASITIPTVRNKLDAQLQTRMLVAELPDYDGRVAEHSREVSRQLLPDRAGQDYGSKVRAWQAALRSLTTTRRVVFPLGKEEFCFDSDAVSHGARLWANLIGLMLANAWLEQRNREVIELSSGERAIVAMPEDYEAAYRIFEATCERSVVNLSDTHRKVLRAVYELKQESDLAEGFSQRKVAQKAGVSVSTVSEHKTYLTKSVKLLREADEGGLTLVADAEPSWWEKGDLLVGFPRPEQVRVWWEEQGPTPALETAEHAEQNANEAQGPPDDAGNSVRLSAEQSLNGTEHCPSGNRVDERVWQGTLDVRQGGEHEKGLGKGQTVPADGVFGMFGTSEDREPLCNHDVPGGKGCYLCDPHHPYRLKEGAK
jgi:transcriptional regulator with XRE-family HTH domain